MTPKQLLALSKRKHADLERARAKMLAQVKAAYDLAVAVETEIDEARETMLAGLGDEDGELDEFEEEIQAVLDDELFPPTSEDLALANEALEEDWESGMRRFADGIASLEATLASR